MPELPETRPVNKGAEVEKIRKEVKKKISEANTEEKKQKLGEEIRKKIEDVKTAADEVAADVKGPMGAIRNEHIDSGKRVFRALTFAVEAAKAGIQVAKTDQGQEVFKKLPVLTYEKASLIVSYLGDYLLGEKSIIIGSSGQPKTDFEKSYENLAAVDHLSASVVREALVQAAEEGKMGRLSENEVRERLKVEERERMKERGGYQDFTYSELVARLEPEEKEFFQALSSPNEFIAYLKKIIEEKGYTGDDLSKFLEKRIRGVMYQIYYPELVKPKTDFLENLEREGTIYANITSFYYTLRGRLLEISSSGLLLQDETLAGVDFFIPKRQEVETFDEKTNQIIKGEKILPENKKVNIREFLTYLHAYVLEGERTRLRYGYNFDVIRMNPYKINPQTGLFKTLAGYAGNLKSHQIDEIFARDEELITAAISIADQKENLNLLFTNWRQDPEQLSAYFAAFSRVEQDIREFLMKNFKEKYGLWEIERAIFNSKLILHGVLLSSFLKLSYAEAPATAAGEPTYVGLAAAPFGVNMLEKRFLSLTLTCYGVDFMPINFFFDKYDFRRSEEFEKAYKNTPTRGRAAYWGLVRDEFLKLRLLIELGNITKSGGFFELASWRLFPAFKEWLKNGGFIGADEKIIYSQDYEVLVKAWQSVENIGIDILEEFTNRFILKEIGKRGKILRLEARDRRKMKPEEIKNKEKEYENKTKALRTFFEHLYDTYLTTEMGKALIKNKNTSGEEQLVSREQWVAEAMRGFLDKDLTWAEKIEIVRGKVYQALTVMMWQRLPVNFISLEKPELSQNGLTIKSRLIRYLKQNGLSDDKAVGKLKQALDDLVLVQTLLRLKVNQEMEKLQRERGNLFGELVMGKKSEVNRGRGHMINEEVIKEILSEQLPEDGREERIRAVIEIYKKTQEFLKSSLPKADWEPEEEYNQRRKFYLTPLEYFCKLYTDGEFGFSSTNADIAFKFLNFSASGPDTIYRMMNYDADTAEKTTTFWNGFYEVLKPLKSAKGDVEASKFYEKLYELINSIRGQTGPGEIPERVLLIFLMRAAYYIKANDPVSPLTGFAENLLKWAANIPSAVSEKDVGGPWSPNAFKANQNDLVKIFSAFAGDVGEALLPRHAEEPTMKELPVEKYGILGKIYKKITGKDKIRVRDYESERSVSGLKYFFGAGGWKYFERYLSPRLAIALLLLVLALAYLAGKKDLKVGGQK